MVRGPALLPLTPALAAAFAVALALAAPRPPLPAGEFRDVLFAQEALPTDPAAPSSQKLGEEGAEYRADYAFENFNRDHLQVTFRYKKPDLQAYEAAWGYSKADLDGLKSWLNKARQDALADASAHGRSQEQLNAAVAALQKEYKRKQAEYFAARGFSLAPDGEVRVDMPALVRRNAPLVKPLAGQFDSIARDKKYDPDDVIGAAAALVQTALLYKVPPNMDGDRHTGGLLPPVSALLKGWGDCDTKSGVLASILTNYPKLRMVGISVPEHYLVGVLGLPHKGQLFVEYQGLQYVLIEPAGPAWLPPGAVAETTSALLGAVDGYKIEPFF